MVPTFVQHGQEVRNLSTLTRDVAALKRRAHMHGGWCNNQVVDILKEHEGQALDVQELFCRATLDSIGGKLGSLSLSLSLLTSVGTY
jgi:hypothetical protein